MKWKNRLRMMAIGAAVVLVAACGGEEAPGPDTSTTNPTAPTLSALEITVASPTLLAKADQSTTVTITAVDANRRALADVPVTLSASSGVVSGQSTTTDAQGRMTATFGLGSDRGNRDVPITAANGAVVGTAGIQVSGTTLTLTASPPTALSATTPVEISASVVDAAKVPLGGVVVSFDHRGNAFVRRRHYGFGRHQPKCTLTGVTADVSVTATGANAHAAPT